MAKPTEISKKKGSESVFVPSFLLSNVQSLAPKIDEIHHCISNANLDFACLTETWLKEYIQDSVVAINGYNLIRLDRRSNDHGGVCMYIKNATKYSVLHDLLDPVLEVLWVKLQPTRLPRGFSTIVVGVLYHPPRADNASMLNYLIEKLTLIESQYANCGVIILGDFNHLRHVINKLKYIFNLKQIVPFATRGSNKLDLILTNLQNFYNTPVKRPNFGLSDHVSVEVQPKQRVHLPRGQFTVKKRDLRPSSRLAMRSYLQQVDVPSLLGTVESCAEKVLLLDTIIKTGLDFILPLRPKTIHSSEPPWMNPTFKNLIKSRQSALSNGNMVNFRLLRNRVNRERKICREKYYKAKVSHLNECKPSLWWKEVKKLSGMASTSGRRDDSTKLLHQLGAHDMLELANNINDAFLSPMSDFVPLPSNFQPVQSSVNDSVVTSLTVSSYSVYKKLSTLNSTKAQGPDNTPAWLLKENADLLVDPVSDILNSSYREGCLPPIWKSADVVPIPKQNPPKDINKDLRPISLTPIMSKIAEEFVVEVYMKPAILAKIKENQFGAIPKSSTTFALISMFHKWTKDTDGNGATTRVVLFDFRKAFDLIDHNILATKLATLNIPYKIECWIIDFLKHRKQRVKLADDCKSEWRDIPAGVPQGTKLGPWLFLLLIDDIDVTNTDMWKFVDDTTMSECVERDNASTIQNAVTEFSDKAHANKFQMNETKCKELRISFAKTNPQFEPVMVNEKPLEIVQHVKLLGLNISSDLKWNSHVSKITKKAAPRFYFLRQLKRAAIPTKDLLKFYITCIRPIFEYACPVYHNSLPKYLSDDIERLQKRALRIIYPWMPYTDSIEESGLSRLSERRQLLTCKLFNEITQDQSHKLRSLLPSENNCKYQLRHKRQLNVPRAKTDRFKNSFIVSNSNIFNL